MQPVHHSGGEDPSPPPVEGEAGRGSSSGNDPHYQVADRVSVPQHELGNSVHLHLHLLADLQRHLRKRHHAQREQRLRLGRHREPGGSREGARLQGEEEARKTASISLSFLVLTDLVLQCLRLLTHTFNSEYSQVVNSISDCKVGKKVHMVFLPLVRVLSKQF